MRKTRRPLDGWRREWNPVAAKRKTQALRRFAQCSRRVVGFWFGSFEGGWEWLRSGGVGSSGRQVGDTLCRRSPVPRGTTLARRSSSRLALGWPGGRLSLPIAMLTPPMLNMSPGAVRGSQSSRKISIDGSSTFGPPVRPHDRPRVAGEDMILRVGKPPATRTVIVGRAAAGRRVPLVRHQIRELESGYFGGSDIHHGSTSGAKYCCPHW